MSCAIFVSVLSSLFRVASFVFLRVIPSPLLKIALPILFAAHATVFLLHISLASKPQSNVQLGELEKMKFQNSRSNRQLPKTLFSFLLTLPSSSIRLQRLSLLVNALLLLFVGDLVTHPIRYPAHEVAFARIGAVDHNSVKISVRYPGDGSSNLHKVKVLVRPSADKRSDWMNGPIVDLTGENDWVGTAVISGLWPGTVYDYKLCQWNSSNDLPYPPSPLQFETFPDPRLGTGSYFRFIASSCLLPNFPYCPGKGDRIKGFDLMAKELFSEGELGSPDNFEHSASSQTDASEQASTPTASKASLTKFLLLLGDFIYADVPAYGGSSIEAYRRLYRRVYASPSFRKIYERLPTLHIYDDHEIINNFVGEGDDSTFPFPNASEAFNLYNAKGNYDSRHRGQYYYDFRHGDVAFFILDTRRYRTKVPQVDESRPSILGEQQHQAFRAWLAEANETSTFKFVVTSVPFTSLWQHDAQTDSWAAYSGERDALLEILHTVPNLFILSGDRHEFAAIEFNGAYDWSHTIYEFSTSPLSMFYVPFVRTLEMNSSEKVERNFLQPNTTSPDTRQTLSQEKHLIPKERVIRYLPVGNYKWTSFEIDTRNTSKPVISAEVMIDGRLAYRWSKIGSPVPTKRPTSLSLFVPQSLGSVLGKFGLEYRKWF